MLAGASPEKFSGGGMQQRKEGRALGIGVYEESEGGKGQKGLVVGLAGDQPNVRFSTSVMLFISYKASLQCGTQFLM